MSEKLLTIREVASILGLNEKEVVELAEQGKIPAYKVGGIYLRFQREQIEQYKDKAKPANYKPVIKNGYTPSERIRDFFYFYDFYLISGILLMILLAIIAKG
ncbi:MAG TPA: helix-turn-helix domain-containing protein [Candidatus Omnitrophota bacterium]|nr:helix-turn-helix domain-containing protein [Candidatus Omnitrophota bacterium]